MKVIDKKTIFKSIRNHEMIDIYNESTHSHEHLSAKITSHSQVGKKDINMPISVEPKITIFRS